MAVRSGGRRAPSSLGTGLGLGPRFALTIGGVTAALLFVFALVLLNVFSGALEEQIDRSGVEAVRALAAGGEPAWVPPADKAEKKRFLRDARGRLKRLVDGSGGLFLNAYLTDTGNRILVQRYKVRGFAPSRSGRRYGRTTVTPGIYVSGEHGWNVRQFKTPVLDPKERVVAYAHVVQEDRVLASSIGRVRTTILTFSVLLMAIVLGVAFNLAGRIAGPLRALVQAVSRINRGNLHYRSTIRSGDEVGRLARAIEAMTEGLREGEEASERLSEHVEEVQVLSELQAAHLPQKLPRAEGFEIDSAYQQGSDGVAGFYDAIPLDDGRLALVVASTSGKGALGAVLAAMTRAYVRAYLESTGDAGNALRATNLDLAAGMRKGLHVTVQVAVLDTRKGRATVFIAGHRAPLYACRGGDISVVHGEGLALGLDKGPVFDKRLEEVVVDMPPGTRIVLTTTGTFDVENPKGKRFGVERFQDLVRKHAPKNTGAFLHLVLGALDAYIGDAERRLDAILVSAKRMV